MIYKIYGKKRIKIPVFQCDPPRHYLMSRILSYIMDFDQLIYNLHNNGRNSIKSEFNYRYEYIAINTLDTDLIISDTCHNIILNDVKYEVEKIIPEFRSNYSQINLYLKDLIVEEIEETNEFYNKAKEFLAFIDETENNINAIHNKKHLIEYCEQLTDYIKSDDYKGSSKDELIDYFTAMSLYTNIATAENGEIEEDAVDDNIDDYFSEDNDNTKDLSENKSSNINDKLESLPFIIRRLNPISLTFIIAIIIIIAILYKFIF